MMTDKQEIRYKELELALKQLAQDVYTIHWKDLDKKTKDELMVKFNACLVRLETALSVDQNKSREGADAVNEAMSPGPMP